MIASITRVRSVNPVQLGIVAGVTYAILGFIAALFFVAVGSFAAPLNSSYSFIAHARWLALIGFPIGYFAGGFIGGVIGAAVYNLVARWTGGIEFTLEHPG